MRHIDLHKLSSGSEPDQCTGSRKTQSGNAVVKYCSDRCRHHKPGPVDRRIDDTFVALLEGEEDVGTKDQAITQKAKPRRKLVKGESRILVECGTVEGLVFGSRHDPEKVFGRRKNRATRALATDDGEWKSVDMQDTDGSVDSERDEPAGVQLDDQRAAPGPIIRPPQTESAVNGSIGGEKGWAERKEETTEELEKRRAGQRRAEEREMVRRAARRACAFGLKVKGWDKGATATKEESKGKGKKHKNQGSQDGEAAMSEGRRKCEAVMSGVVVESSFAKGEWAIRWRE